MVERVVTETRVTVGPGGMRGSMGPIFKEEEPEGKVATEEKDKKEERVVPAGVAPWSLSLKLAMEAMGELAVEEELPAQEDLVGRAVSAEAAEAVEGLVLVGLVVMEETGAGGESFWLSLERTSEGPVGMQVIRAVRDFLRVTEVVVEEALEEEEVFWS